MIFEHTNYRSYLKTVLAERQLKNRAYSLRAMARDLGLTPSHLSAIHSGSKGLSLEAALRISRQLELDEKETEYFTLLVQYENVKSAELKESVLRKLQSLNDNQRVTDLSVDLFKTIANWYHIPILEMTELDGFDFTAKNIARRLGISALEAEIAIERLERLELLERDEQGRYRKALNNYLFKSDKPNPALRQFHRQMIGKAAESLETQSPQERYVGSQTFSIDIDQLPEARAIIEECRQKLVDLFDRGKRRTQTYHLGVQLFNLTASGTEKSKTPQKEKEV